MNGALLTIATMVGSATIGTGSVSVGSGPAVIALAPTARADHTAVPVPGLLHGHGDRTVIPTNDGPAQAASATATTALLIHCS
ncbi:hypothetical protein ACFV6F_32085 [Kitasatospora phosalacinea]|uniref:hypothetical protein n=1 Tax=Kitasatospora phosalacinea TaxID=2065 RepID=UPI00365CA494